MDRLGWQAQQARQANILIEEIVVIQYEYQKKKKVLSSDNNNNNNNISYSYDFSSTYRLHILTIFV